MYTHPAAVLAVAPSVNDILTMVAAPARLFDASGLRNAANPALRHAFVQAVADAIVEYAQAVLRSCGEVPGAFAYHP